MDLVDKIVFGLAVTFAIVLFYKAFFQGPKAHALGGDGGAGEADTGDSDELGLDRD